MSVWLCIPSKRQPLAANHALCTWKDHGYKIALQRDKGEDELMMLRDLIADELHFREYKGYPEATNWLIADVMSHHVDAEWFVITGDDTYPDMRKTADEIALECYHYCSDSTFGVMQPTGDRWADSQGVCIERIAGSPWIGRQYARRINGGSGPSWPEYYHMFNDEELQLVAQKYGVFWQRPDLTHLHNHWGRPRGGEKIGNASRMPEFLTKANSAEEWNRSSAIFKARKAAGFPGSEPIP